MKANQPMSCILKSTSDVKAIRESYEGNYIEPNVPDSVGKLDDRAEERTLEKKHEISELCLVLESSTLSDTERYGHVSSFTHDRCCVKLSPSNMIGSNAAFAFDLAFPFGRRKSEIKSKLTGVFQRSVVFHPFLFYLILF